MEEWLSFLSRLAFIPLATIAVYEGVRRCTWRWSNWRPAAHLLFGIGMLGGDAASKFVLASSIESSLKVIAESPTPRVPESAFDQMSPREREEKSRLLAQIAFDRDGSLISYISISGERIGYAPSEKEIRDRQNLAESLAQTRIRLEFIRTQAWMFTLAAAVATLAGLYIRLRGGSRHAG